MPAKDTAVEVKTTDSLRIHIGLAGSAPGKLTRHAFLYKDANRDVASCQLKGYEGRNVPGAGREQVFGCEHFAKGKTSLVIGVADWDIASKDKAVQELGSNIAAMNGAVADCLEGTLKGTLKKEVSCRKIEITINVK